MTDIQDYFQAAGYQPDDLISVNWKKPSGLGFRIVRVADAEPVIAARAHVDCWISAATLNQPADSDSRGTVTDVASIPSLWADLDVGEGKLASYAQCREVIREVSGLLGSEPSVLVASGHGLQPRWIIGEDMPENAAELVERFGQLVEKVAQTVGGHVDNVYDLARIVRAPGTTNCKDPDKNVPVQIKVTPQPHGIGWRWLASVLEEYVPLTPQKESRDSTEDREIEPTRGNAYVRAACSEIRARLLDIAEWPVGKTDDRGRGWEKIQADSAFRLAALAKADWNDLSIDDAKKLFVDSAPVGSGWTVRDVINKWSSQVHRAEPSPPPAVVTDPLAPGFGADASPHPGAPSGAADRGSAGPAGAAGGSDPGVVGEAAPGVQGGGLEGSQDELSWKKYDWDDMGFAERVIRHADGLLKYSPQLGVWFRYRDGVWSPSDRWGSKAAQDMLRDVLRLETKLYSDEVIRKGSKVTTQQNEFSDWVTAQKSAYKIRSATEIIKNDGYLDVDLTEFDADPMLLNVRNGVVDLRTGDLLEHDPRLLMRTQLAIDYDPDATAPLWEAYLKVVMPTVDLQNYLQRIVGYSITGHTSEQAIFVHHGKTQNGKSVFTKVVASFMGPLASSVDPTVIMSTKFEQHPTGIASMEGKRLLMVQEGTEGARLNEALIKRLSGGDIISARLMGKDFHDFVMVGKVHMATNHLPRVSGDPAIKRRLKVIPWDVYIEPENRDHQLDAKILKTELPGVLAWAVRGAIEWQKVGLAVPVESQIALEEWTESEDVFGHWLAESVIEDEGARTLSKQLYLNYCRWSESMRMKPMSYIHFGRKMSGRGYKSVHTKIGNAWAARLTMQDSMHDPLGGF